MSIEDALRALNGWWTSGEVNRELAKPYRRKLFSDVRMVFTFHRQVILLIGLRRVGKTTIMYRLISDLIKRETPRRVLYFSFDAETPGLVELLEVYRRTTGID